MLIYPDSVDARERASQVVEGGGLVAFRTDTFYGVGADPFDEAALGLINALKGRDGKPILVLAADPADAERLIAERTRAFDLLAASHWPGALTLVAAARAEAPELLTAGTCTVGVRLPDDEEARAIVRACGGLLTATSANPAGRPPARTAAEVAGYFPDGLGLVIDGGATRTELPSTVIDVTGLRPRLIREGVVTRAELGATLKAAGIEF
ncbi:MAG TPA: L-threonylcarbamoyladenylate synthase [Pyrinomonadaceae bacterium]|nr:L-threonylcarbamoyladenylate synthase [Pyrinomonadaceae bacterium]